MYGCIGPGEVDGDLVRVLSIVEKPDPADAPSDLAVIGRYVLAPAIFDALRRTTPGAGGEIQLTDAIGLLAADEPVFALPFASGRFDVGNPLDAHEGAGRAGPHARGHRSGVPRVARRSSSADDVVAARGRAGRTSSRCRRWRGPRCAKPHRATFIHPGDLAWWLGWWPKTDGGARRDHPHVGGRRERWSPGWSTTPATSASASRRALWTTTCCSRRWTDGSMRACVGTCAPSATTIRWGSRGSHAAGYRRIPDDMVAFSLDLDRLEPSEPDPRVSTVARSDDLGARLSVTHAAFGVDRPFDDYVAGYRRFMDSPAYPDGWDLVAWTPAGEAAACCIAWPDPVSRVGNFEPVATHPSFHRQGFATVVLRDGLRRLREAGMRRAVVRTPRRQRARRSPCIAPWGSSPTTSSSRSDGPTADGPID